MFTCWGCYSNRWENQNLGPIPSHPRQIANQLYLPAGNICLDPNKQDLFVIIVRNPNNTLFPTNPLPYVSAALSQGGLGIVVHPIYVSAPLTNRAVFSGSNQKAVQVTESMDTTSPDILGFSNTGTPNDLDNTTIFTARIKNFIQTTCGNGTNGSNGGAPTYGTIKCADSTGLYAPGPLK